MMADKTDKNWYFLAIDPEDLELLTLKAVRILKKADIILYEKRINPEIFDLFSPACIKLATTEIFREKTGQKTKDSVNLPAELSNKYQVVRLRGGEPFFSGRDREELSLAERLGFSIHYIPGVSRMQAMGRYGIPLTHRGVSDGIWVLHASRPGPNFLVELRTALQTRSTLVIYGGMQCLGSIARAGCLANKGNTPLAVVHNLSSGHQQFFFTTVAEVEIAAARHALAEDAFLVIGEVVGLGKSRLGKEASFKRLESGS